MTTIDNTNDTRARERGLEIARRFPVTRDGDHWVVPHPPSRSFRCRVVLHDDPAECRCNCQEFEAAWQPCCHIHAARFADRRERGERLPEPDYPSEVPPGAPKWITPELMRETYRVWDVYYAERLTPIEAMAIIIDIGRLCDA